MSNPLQQTIEALAKEKGIEPDVVISAIEEAVATASRKYYKTGENLKTRFNTETGQVDLFALKTVVEEVADAGDRDRDRPRRARCTARSTATTSPTASSSATRWSSRSRPRCSGASPRRPPSRSSSRRCARPSARTSSPSTTSAIGEVVNGTVKRFENGDIILEIGRIEAVLPRKEQSRAESYTPGDRVRTVIKGVNRSAKGPQIVLSRTDPALLIKLFEQEVPEIYDGTVMIRGAVREAGDRAKVAVFSRERDVDPVGACVGMKGTRVQSIIRELRGEKIDIVEWSDDPIAFVTNALSPAKVQRVSIVDDGERVMEVVVEDKQLSLAIGKKGQNVRLAAKLTGWRIDIKSEEEKRREVEAQFGGLEAGDRRRSAPTTAPRRPTAATPRRRRRRPTAHGARRASGRGAAALHAGRHRREDRPQARRRRASRRSRRSPPRPPSSCRRSRASAARPPRRFWPPRAARRRRRARRRASSRARALIEVTVGNCSDLQGRGAARHHEPGSDGAAQARSRHRGEERVEHDRGSRGAPVRRAPGAAAQHHAADGDIFAETPVAKGKKGSAPAKKAAEPAKPAAPVAAAAAPRQNRQARRRARRGRAGRRRARTGRRRAGRGGAARRRSREPAVVERAADARRRRAD